jgi:hypothetical protein
MNDETRIQQRNFYMRLSPINGHEIAESEGGFVTPSEEALEHEIRDTLRLWMTLQQGKGGEAIANCSWWMTQYMDPDRKFDANEGVETLDKLTSFAVSVIGILIDNGVLEMVEDVELPDIRLSSETSFDALQLDFLKSLEDIMRKDDEDD